MSVRALLFQIAIGVGTSLVVSMAVEHWRIARSRAPLSEVA